MATEPSEDGSPAVSPVSTTPGDRQRQTTLPYRVLVVEQLGELWDGAGGQLGIVLVVDEVHDGRLQHLRGLCQALDVGLLPLQLGADEQRAVLHRLGVHGGPDALGPGHGQLSLHFRGWGGWGGSVRPRLSPRSAPSPALS